MKFFRRNRQPQPLQPFTVVALRQHETPIRIGLMALTKADAITAARELFPQHILGVAELEPEWEEGKA